MRIAMIDPGAFSPLYDDALAAALAGAAGGAEVDLVTSPFVYDAWPEPRGYRRRELFPGAGRVRRGAERGLARRLRRLRRAILYPAAWRAVDRELSSRPPDLIHLQWSPAPPVDRAYLARAARRGVPLVVTVHNASHHGDEPFRHFDRSRLLALASRLIVHSRHEAAELASRHPALAGKIAVIAPGIAPPEAKRTREEARAALGLPADVPIALFAGLIREYKGLDLLLAAFAETARRLPGALLLVAGQPVGRSPVAAAPAPGWLRSEPGYLARDRFESCLLAADVVVLPYRTASTSAVLGEALAADRAVVVTRAGALLERIGENAGEMIVDTDDRSGLARALERLLADRARADRMGSAKGEELRRRFRWSAAAASTLELYRGALAEAGAPALELEPRTA